MVAYLIVHSTLQNPEQFQKYIEASAESLSHHQGEYLLGGLVDSVLEGRHDKHRTVIFRFPSTKCAKAWYSSEEYSRVKPLREGTGDFDFVLIESFE